MRFSDRKSLATLADYPFIQHEPYGVAMIIGAWNYPVNLLLGPLVGAIGAGANQANDYVIIHYLLLL